MPRDGALRLLGSLPIGEFGVFRDVVGGGDAWRWWYRLTAPKPGILRVRVGRAFVERFVRRPDPRGRQRVRTLRVPWPRRGGMPPRRPPGGDRVPRWIPHEDLEGVPIVTCTPARIAGDYPLSRLPSRGEVDVVRARCAVRGQRWFDPSSEATPNDYQPTCF